MGKIELINTYLDTVTIVNELRSVVSDNIAGYYLGNSNDVFGVYYDDGKYSVAVGASIGCEILEEERPIATKTCPGIGNIHESFFTDGWTTENKDGTYTETETGKILTIEECIS